MVRHKAGSLFGLVSMLYLNKHFEPVHSAVRRQFIVSNPIKTNLFPTRLPQKNRAPGFETRKVAAQGGGEISDTIYLHLRLAIYVRNFDLKHKSFG